MLGRDETLAKQMKMRTVAPWKVHIHFLVFGCMKKYVPLKTPLNARRAGLLVLVRLKNRHSPNGCVRIVS